MSGDVVPVGPLMTLIAGQPQRSRVWMPAGRPKAVTTILQGIVGWLEDRPTISAGIVEDLARAIEKCKDPEELRDLSVQLRKWVLAYDPDASRVALTENEALVLGRMA